MVRVDGTVAGDTPRREYPRDERDWRSPTGVSVNDGGTGLLSGGGGGGGAGLPGCCWKSSSGLPAGGFPPVGAVNPSGTARAFGSGPCTNENYICAQQRQYNLVNYTFH